MTNLNTDSSSVQSYLTILQNIISRMASNSASCKTWCVTLVSAILVLIADKSKPDYALIAVIPILLFFFLDAYYLGLERGFRDSYNEFIKKLHANSAVVEDIFIVSPGGGTLHILGLTFKSLYSISVWPFYGVLLVMVQVAKKGVLS